MSKSFIAKVAVGLLMTTSAAFAHAHLKSSTPARNATVAAKTADVTLNFSEAVHIKMSQFKVMPVKDMAAGDAAFKKSLDAKNDTAARSDSGVLTTEASSTNVKIKLRQPLMPGNYVVMWKVMAADDGHMTSGHYLFQVKK